MSKDKNNLPHAVIHTRLTSLASNLIGETEIEKKTDLDGNSQQFFNLILKISLNSYKVICFICSDEENCPGRRHSFAAEVPVLARSMVDSLALILYISENPTKRIQEYLLNGWRDLQEEKTHHLSTPNTGPAWDAWLVGFDELLLRYQRDYQISDSYKQNPGNIRKFPNPSKILTRNILTDPNRRQFARHLNIWFYRNLSQTTHMHSWPGLMERVKLIALQEMEGKEAMAQQARSNVLVVAITLFTCILTETLILFEKSYNTDAQFIWTMLSEYFNFAKELHELRYKDLLQE